MQVPLLDLRAQYAPLKEEILAAVAEICDSQRFILGDKVETLEKELADYCRSGAAVGVSSGSDALLIALMAEKRLNVDALTTHRLPLDQIGEASDLLVDHPDQSLGVILTMKH